ncbi:MAG: DUF3800 domain-containing protein [Parcubacteria group bacterium]|nr:DUF3800 domain-containing protein [Parcubacteria group bacterium]
MTRILKEKLYCFVDESGQDTKGVLFLVTVVITNKISKEKIEKELLKIEDMIGKKIKWHGVSFEQRVDYLEAVLDIKEIKSSIFYSIYKTTKEYTSLTTYTIAKAIGVKAKKPYEATIIIDGLNEKERQRTKVGLRQLGVKYKKVRGIKDESSPLVRLADALAGFVRDYEEGQSYAKPIFNRFLVKKILTKLE